MNFEKVRDVIVETVNLNPEEIKLESNLKENLNLDSLDAVELNMALEEAFDITIDDEELMKFITVKDIVDYIDANVAA
ncbi:acyl carrier protein [Lachnobacterium bovis]|jgi:acyl carrier protein|uniref:Acyl carrier protein n=1 Tax=Lachnobacterium bovis DSM 14045 TaxID=1122142 RepID=A0A1H3I7Q8_9FIRM|nr:acyl carrier protein [Lachnobacterium bovis]MBQ1802425.1 acyl carrier protein [Lachnobacterium sp.]SDY23239.1 acyl carrier protein [Lachnobacterium bovis DSM 14045]